MDRQPLDRRRFLRDGSLLVACAATGLVGEEGNLFRFTLKHALFLTTVMGCIVALQAYVFPWMIP